MCAEREKRLQKQCLELRQSSKEDWEGIITKIEEILEGVETKKKESG